MSGAVRAAARVDSRRLVGSAFADCRGIVDTERESDLPVLTVVPFTRAPRRGHIDTMSAVRQVLSGSSGSVVDAGVC